MASIYELLTGQPEQQPQATPIDWNNVQASAQQPQPQAPQQQPGILQQAATGGQGILDSIGLKTDNFGGRLGNALMAAGSPNPASAMLQLKKADAEEADSKKPKVTPLANGAFSLITFPDGRSQVVKNEDVAKFVEEQNTNKFEQTLQKILFGKQTDAQLAGAKDDIKRAGDAREQLNQSKNLYDGWTKAKEIVEGQIKESPTMSKVQGALPGISGFFGGDQVAANKFLQGLTVDETLLNTAKTKGAISDKEMELFKSPIPALSDDREAVWKPYIEERLKVLEKLKKFQESEVARGANASQKVTGGGLSSPQGTSSAPEIKPADKAAVEASGLVYDPAYEYAFVDGKIKRKKK